MKPIIIGAGLRVPLQKGPLYRLQSEGQEMFAWVDHVDQDGTIIWFRQAHPTRGKLSGFSVESLNRMEIGEVENIQHIKKV